MNHIPNPIYENTSGRTSISLVSTILITGGLFLLIPITQLSSEWLKPPSEDEQSKTAFIKPPPLIPDLEKIEDEPEPIDEDIDLKVDHPPLTLTQLILTFAEGKGSKSTFFSDLKAPEFGQQQLIYFTDELDVPPKVVAFAAPVYPPQLKRERVEGSVEVIYLVTEKGKVQSISIKKCFT